jgi:hypothetical protein
VLRSALPIVVFAPQATYEEAKSKCSRQGMILVTFECQTEWIEFKENVQIATGKLSQWQDIQ